MGLMRSLRLGSFRATGPHLGTCNTTVHTCCAVQHIPAHSGPFLVVAIQRDSQQAPCLSEPVRLRLAGLTSATVRYIVVQSSYSTRTIQGKLPSHRRRSPSAGVFNDGALSSLGYRCEHRSQAWSFVVLASGQLSLPEGRCDGAAVLVTRCRCSRNSPAPWQPRPTTTCAAHPPIYNLCRAVPPGVGCGSHPSRQHQPRQLLSPQTSLHTSKLQAITSRDFTGPRIIQRRR